MNNTVVISSGGTEKQPVVNDTAETIEELTNVIKALSDADWYSAVLEELMTFQYSDDH